MEVEDEVGEQREKQISGEEDRGRGVIYPFLEKIYLKKYKIY